MARKRSVVIMKSVDGQMEPLGFLRHVAAALGKYNIAPDGSGPAGFGERMGTGVLFGPGMVVEVALNDPTITGDGPEIAQVLVTITDEDFAFPVLLRLCRGMGWRMVDPDSGRSFG